MNRHYLSGFTLIEIAVVLFIFGLLIAGLLGPLETQLEARDRAATIETMDEIVESLYGYAITNGRLPCPNVSGDGMEQIDSDLSGLDDAGEFNGATTPTYAEIVASGGQCLSDEGFLPWVTLGIPQGDAWGNRFLYRVSSPGFSTRDSDGICNGDTAMEFDLCVTGDIIVTTRGDNPATTPAVEGKASLNLAQTLPAVIISHGRNGFGATSITGVVRQLPPASNLDELANSTREVNGAASPTFLTRIFTGENGGCSDDTDEANPLCEYDDIVRWISPALLNNRMVVAGQLP